MAQYILFAILKIEIPGTLNRLVEVSVKVDDGLCLYICRVCKNIICLEENLPEFRAKAHSSCSP